MQVWPSVLYVKILREDSGDSTPIWPITFRGEWQRDEWFDYGEKNWRIAILPANVEFALARIAPENALPPLVKIVDRPSIGIWRVKP